MGNISNKPDIRISPNCKETSTHTLALMRAVKETEGDVCELGAGFSSTALLHWICQGRKLVTYENNPGYVHYARKFRTYNHKVKEVKDWNEVDFNRHWSVVFVDHTIGKRSWEKGLQRGDTAVQFKNADILVMHDSEKPEHYHYDMVYPHYKYRFDWTECKPWTVVLSNVIDVSKWQNCRF